MQKDKEINFLSTYQNSNKVFLFEPPKNQLIVLKEVYPLWSLFVLKQLKVGSAGIYQYKA